jgi:hypothetical protein
MKQMLTESSTPPLDRIMGLYQFKIDYLTNKGSFSLGCFLCNITLEMADVSEAIALEATRCLTDEYAPLRACLQGAQEAGALDFFRDLDQLIHLIRNSWLGALIIMKANKSSAPPGRIPSPVRENAQINIHPAVSSFTGARLPLWPYSRRLVILKQTRRNNGKYYLQGYGGNGRGKQNFHQRN